MNQIAYRTGQDHSPFGIVLKHAREFGVANAYRTRTMLEGAADKGPYDLAMKVVLVLADQLQHGPRALELAYVPLPDDRPSCRHADVAVLLKDCFITLGLFVPTGLVPVGTSLRHQQVPDVAYAVLGEVEMLDAVFRTAEAPWKLVKTL